MTYLVPERVAASRKCLLLNLVPLIVNLLLLVNVATEKILVGPEKSDCGVLVVHENISAVACLEDTMLLQGGSIVLWVLLAPTVSLLTLLTSLVKLGGDGICALGEYRIAVCLSKSSHLIRGKAADGDAEGDLFATQKSRGQ